MKTTAIVCAVLAGSFAFSSVAVAQDGRRDRNDRNDRDDRVEQRQDRREHRAERRDDRQERRERQAFRQDRQEDRAYYNGYRTGAQQQPAYRYNQPSYVYSQPGYNHQYNHQYNQPRHYGQSQRYHRGGYLPQQYRSHSYHVNNWNAYPHLYAPPYGHQWVNVGSDFVLIALATGLIANALSN